MDETFPDLGSLSDAELKDVIRQLTEEETEISYRRRILHGKIDILRAELVNRLRDKHEGGEALITGEDVQRLTDILAQRHGRATGRRRRHASGADEPMALHCTECGFVNTEGANYCQRCGALLPRVEGHGDPATATYRIGETGELMPVEIGEVTERGPGARHPCRRRARGESFAVDGERMSIGRRPDSEVFLDDITVSRDHALLIHRGERLVPRRLRLAERHLRQPLADRVAPPAGRRRGADRQVQADLPRALMAGPATPTDTRRLEPAGARPGRPRARARRPSGRSR